MAAQPAKVQRRAWWRAMEFLVPVLVVVGWFVLQRYILPSFGVPT